MSALEIHQYPYMQDNYGVLLHSPQTGETVAVDCGDASATLDALKQTGWKLSHIWITHHHADHTAGTVELKSATGAHVTGPEQLSGAIAGLDSHVNDGHSFTFADHDVQVLHTPGHTTDMMNFYLPDQGIVFTGDTLFTLGCGRLFEGDAEMMHASLQKLAALPPATVVYCSHEYTQANAAFALSVDPDNQALIDKSKAVAALRASGDATVPTTIRTELECNPFLRAADGRIRKLLDMVNATDSEVFAEIRRRKDNF